MTLPLIAQAARRIREFGPGVPVYENQAPEPVEGTGAAVIEVQDGGPWGRSDLNARRRVLQINILADRTRDEDGLPVADDADSRCWALWEQVDPLVNDPGQDWRQGAGGWRAIHHARRSDGPVLTLVPEGDGAVMLSARYEVSHD